MGPLAQQLAFDLPADVRLGGDDFFVSAPNELAYALLQQPQSWPNAVLALVGPAGSGKTHLARIFAAQTGAKVLHAADIHADTPLPAGPLVIEDGDALPAEAQEWLFHAYNIALRDAHPLLLTSQDPPARWGVTLPDLASRLSSITTAKIDDPDDALLTAVLLKHFADRQLVPAPDAVSYLLNHVPRSFAALRDIVATLDREALAQGKPLTRPFVRAVLDRQG